MVFTLECIGFSLTNLRVTLLFSYNHLLGGTYMMMDYGWQATKNSISPSHAAVLDELQDIEMQVGTPSTGSLLAWA